VRVAAANEGCRSGMGDRGTGEATGGAVKRAVAVEKLQDHLKMLDAGLLRSRERQNS